MKKTLKVLDKEYHLADEDFIVSKADTKGKITYANQALINISGFTERELLEKPHNILRHPDMPKAAFKDLWTVIQKGEEWHGIIKNLCKDGGYYWVDATVTPSFLNGEIIGYMSVRRQASVKQIDEAVETYSKMREEERA